MSQSTALVSRLTPMGQALHTPPPGHRDFRLVLAAAWREQLEAPLACRGGSRAPPSQAGYKLVAGGAGGTHTGGGERKGQQAEPGDVWGRGCKETLPAPMGALPEGVPTGPLGGLKTCTGS